jgi:zinc D-Ala-D-Ala dipeptidase
VQIPLELFAVESPHPYARLGAPYGEYSPYYLRDSVVKNLIQAQKYLQELHPHWYIQIF